MGPKIIYNYSSNKQLFYSFYNLDILSPQHLSKPVFVVSFEGPPPVIRSMNTNGINDLF